MKHRKAHEQSQKMKTKTKLYKTPEIQSNKNQKILIKIKPAK